MQKIVREISQAIGNAEAFILLRHWGGRELHVPVKVEAGDPLALVLGLDLARKLVSTWPGQKLQLPIEKNALLDLRNASIVVDAGGGLSHEDIGVRYGMSRQNVSRILKLAREG